MPKSVSVDDASETLRLAALRGLFILDTLPEPSFDAITQLGATLMRSETAYLAFVDETRTWIKANFRAKFREYPRHESNAERIVLERNALVILDLEELTPASNMANVHKASGLRFFAGVPVRTPGGLVIGALCVGGSAPRESVTLEELLALEQLSSLVTDELELRRLRARFASATLDRSTAGLHLPTIPEQDVALDWPQADDIRKAIKLRQFVLHYQPEIDLETGHIVGLEALVRWQHPERGLIPPLSFIPQAEENGLILPLGDWGMGQACRQLQKWQAEWPHLSKLRMCVNLSARQFLRTGLADHVEALLIETGLSGDQLGLEMTESSLIPNAAEAAEVLDSLHRLGVSLHMDDFGTGYSSLSHLHSFPFDVLKIDRSFVQRIRLGQQSVQIVQTILELARVMGMDVVAEGIETEEQLGLLRTMGCRYGQGYLIARPMPAAEIATLLASPDALVPAGTKTRAIIPCAPDATMPRTHIS